MENSSDRESYSLAAGLGLGLVLMGKGSSESGLNDLSIPDTLNYYMIGGRKRPLTGIIMNIGFIMFISQLNRNSIIEIFLN